MYFESWATLSVKNPKTKTGWDKQRLYLYLLQSCEQKYTIPLQTYFGLYKKDGALADMLFEILFDAVYDGSDAQVAAAYYISQMDKEILRQRKQKLLQAQQNDVEWKRPFLDDDLTWL